MLPICVRANLSVDTLLGKKFNSMSKRNYCNHYNPQTTNKHRMKGNASGLRQQRRPSSGFADVFMTVLRNGVAQKHQIRRTLSRTGGSRIFIILVLIQSFWLLYDSFITSQVYHKPPKDRPKPTEASPLTPFYDEPYEGPARAFSKWAYPKFFPCGSLISQTNLADREFVEEGLLFVKLARARPTVIQEDVTTRIARNVAKRFDNATTISTADETKTLSCTARLAPLKARRWRERNRKKSFLWSSVKEPASRLISMFYDLTSMQEKEDGWEDKEKLMKYFFDYISENELYESSYYFKILTLRKTLNTFRTDLHEIFLKEILYGFDFIGVSERPLESLAVLQLLLGLETQDMLYLSPPGNSNNNSTAYVRQNNDRFRPHRWKNEDKCIKKHIPIATLEMKEWFYTDEAESYLEGDVMIYRAVNKSLDLTIDYLGRDRVDKAVKVLKWAVNYAKQQCDSNTIKYPCTDDGKVNIANDCLFNDVACGYHCLDDVGSELPQNSMYKQLLLSSSDR